MHYSGNPVIPIPVLKISYNLKASVYQCERDCKAFSAILYMNKSIKFQCAKLHYLILQISVNNACSTFLKYNYIHTTNIIMYLCILIIFNEYCNTSIFINALIFFNDFFFFISIYDLNQKILNYAGTI